MAKIELWIISKGYDQNKHIVIVPRKNSQLIKYLNGFSEMTK